MTSKEQIEKWKQSVADDMRFEHTDYVVDDVDYHGLWEKWHYQWGIPFEQDFMGAWRQIGVVADRPICVNVFWYFVGGDGKDFPGFRVAVVEPTSQLVDHKMIEEWEEAVFPCMKKGYRHSNGDNFHNLVLDMERRLGRDFPRRDYVAMREAIERIPLT